MGMVPDLGPLLPGEVFLKTALLEAVIDSGKGGRRRFPTDGALVVVTTQSWTGGVPGHLHGL